MDMLFGLVLLSVIAFVSWVGYLAYQEGIKIETSKRHGEAWLQWLGASSAKRFQPDFELVACAGVVPAVADLVTPAASIGNTASTALANSWGGCFKTLTRPEGPWSGQINPFSKAPVQLVLKCDKSDLSVAGHFFFEKLTPTPPGSPLPVVSSLLTDADPLDQKIQLRLTLCDKGGDSIRIGEVEF